MKSWILRQGALALLLLPAIRGTAASPSPGEADRQLQFRVQGALHADPYFYDQHVDVHVEHGSVVLEGFVFSGWDLRDAIRIATQAAQGHRVIDELTIEEGGRR